MLKTKRIALALTLIAVAVAPAIALGSSARSATNSTTFPDSVGEDALAPDITNTIVSNDDAGNITLQIAVSNRPALTADMAMAIFLDTDQSSATGDPQGLIPGTDYLIQLLPGQVDLFQWNGSDYVSAPSQASLTFSYDATGPIIRVSAADLGKAKVLNFALVVLSGITTDAQGNLDFTNAHRDFAPDFGHGAFTYQVLTKLTLAVTAFTTSPKPVKAGKPFSVGLAATESDTAGPVAQGHVTCVAKIAGKRVAVKSSRIVNGIAVCVWTIPKTAKGKRIQGSITLIVQDAQLSRSFSLKVT